jgi:hypothetical protein
VGLLKLTGAHLTHKLNHAKAELCGGANGGGRHCFAGSIVSCPPPSLTLIVRTTIMNHEQAFVSVFVVREKRARYAEFLPKPKRRVTITNRFCHFFDFIPNLAKQIPRDSDLAGQLRKRGAGDIAHVIGGRHGLDGRDMPLEEAINEAMIDPSGVLISCIPGRLALYMQEFPPGDTFILSYKP